MSAGSGCVFLVAFLFSLKMSWLVYVRAAASRCGCLRMCRQQHLQRLERRWENHDFAFAATCPKNLNTIPLIQRHLLASFGRVAMKRAAQVSLCPKHPSQIRAKCLCSAGKFFHAQNLLGHPVSPEISDVGSLTATCPAKRASKNRKVDPPHAVQP